MKKLFLFTMSLVLSYLITNAQIILANPAVTNRVNDTKSPVQKAVAFRLSPFSYPVSLPANTTTGTELTLTVKEFDLGNNISGSAFTTTESGVYHFDVRLNITFPISEYEDYLRFYLMLNKNGSTLERTVLMNPQTDKSPFHTLAISTTVMLMKGDVITTSYNADANAGERYASAYEVSFSGFKVGMLGEGAAATGVIR
jgi:hypothetical protein